MVTKSRDTFKSFMSAQEGVNNFRLTVEELYAGALGSNLLETT
jgi:hypothetical protein